MNNSIFENSSAVVKCVGLTKSFRDGKLNVDVLNGVDFSVAQSELIAIIGASGAGKSTLLHLLGGLDKPTTGQVLISGVEVHTLSERKKSQLRNRYLGFIYQFHHLLPEFNALENVAMPLLIGGVAPKDAQLRSRDLLEKVGLGHRVLHRVGELSGGERQRVAIARALVNNPVCVLADEPTGNLDNNTAENIINLMLDLNKELKTSFVIVTHDLLIAAKMHRTLAIENGRLKA